MSTLLLDAGNSRLKWRLLDEGAFLDEGALDYAKLDELALRLADHPPVERVLGCNVAGTEVGQRLDALLAPCPIAWLRPEAHSGGLHNHYRNPGQLGADRWAALLGAFEVSAGRDCVVVMAGTAMTVDVLTAKGEFLGGIIVPGFKLMRTALAQGTADLGLPDGDQADFPQSTGEAIVNGALQALVGAIEEMRLRLEGISGKPVRVLLSGGDATLLTPLLAPRLAGRLLPVDNLVLRGLARLAFPEARRKES
ncbi:type III pantothenate kinase [Chitinimonas sp.]|uniref:type III pantothenate kinase n=1 Tax=Chitinimonas sp. TaxID=1934313 RepID=UPI002F953C04